MVSQAFAAANASTIARRLAKEIRPVPASRLGEGWSENLTDLRCVSKARVSKVKVAEIRRPKTACKENIHFCLRERFLIFQCKFP